MLGLALGLAVAGTHIRRGTLTLLTSAAPRQLLTHRLEEATVASLRQTAGASSREEVVLNFGRLTTTTENTNLTLQPGAAPAGMEVFLKLEGVGGGSQDLAHAGEIRVSSLTAGVSQGKSQEFVLEKSIDAASPALLQYYTSRQRLRVGVLSLRYQGGPDFLHYRLGDVVISGFAQAAGTTQREQVKLRFARIEVGSGSAGSSGPSRPRRP